MLLSLNIITIWITSNPDIKGSKKSKDQKSAINNMKKLYKWWKKFIKLFNGCSRIESEAKHKTNYGEGSTSENLLNEIKQIIYSLYRVKKTTKNVYDNIMNSIKV